MLCTNRAWERKHVPSLTIVTLLLSSLHQAISQNSNFSNKYVPPTKPPVGGYCNRNVNKQIPYLWICHTSGNDVTVIDPLRRQIPVQKLGVFHFSEGEHVYHFKVKNSGTYSVRAGGETIANITLHPEHCSCPEDLDSFKERFQCSDFDRKLVSKLLSRYLPNSVSLADFDNEKLFGGRRKDYMRIAIVNNTVYYKRFGNAGARYPTKGAGAVYHFEKFLQSLLRKVKLPDCEFIHTYAYDGPSVPFFQGIPPTIAQGYNENFAEIPGPTGSLLKWILSGRPVEYSASSLQWEDRKQVAYFRGSLTGKAIKRREELKYNFRMRMAMVSQNHSGIDAKVLLRTEGEKEGGDLEPPYSWVPPELGTRTRMARDALKEFKYVINADGNAAAWRMYYQMAMGAVVVKQRSPWKEWWYGKLVPGVNVVETGRYFDNLREVVDWLIQNDDEAKQIARNAFHTWAQHLRPEDAYCWIAFIIAEMAEKLAFKVEVREGMKMAERVQDSAGTCHCQYGGN